MRSVGFGVVAVLSVVGVSGCATSSRTLSEAQFLAEMRQSELKVDALLGDRKTEEAAELLDRLAKDNPVRKEPWVRLAKIRFDAKDYGNAIVAAEEVLERDPSDRVAKSVRAVSGLRVATQSLADLRADAELKGTARADAVSLANALRETLGEEILVPVVEAEGGERAAREDRDVARSVRRKPRRAAPSKAPPPPAVQAAPAAASDPFSVLR